MLRGLCSAVALAAVFSSIHAQARERWSAEGERHAHGQSALRLGELSVGANIDLLAAARSSGPSEERRELGVREIELALEAQVTEPVHAFLFLTKPRGESFGLEEAAVTARLPSNTLLKAGDFRAEFGYLNTVHEPERPQISLPVPVAEFLGEEQLREGALTVGRWFELTEGRRAGWSASVWNGDNAVALNGGASKAYAGKLYARRSMCAFSPIPRTTPATTIRQGFH